MSPSGRRRRIRLVNQDKSRRYLTFIVQFLQQMFVPFDVVALFRGDCGKVHLHKVGHRPWQSPVQGIKATSQIYDLTRLLVANLLEYPVQTHLNASYSGKVAAVDLGSLSHRVLDKVSDVLVFPVAQLNST